MDIKIINKSWHPHGANPSRPSFPECDSEVHSRFTAGVAEQVRKRLGFFFEAKKK